jgi:hypothetical protein
MITSAPAASAAFASATVVAVANHEIRRDFNSATKPGGYNPIIDDTAGGVARNSASHCSSKSCNANLAGVFGNWWSPTREKLAHARFVVVVADGWRIGNPEIHLKWPISFGAHFINPPLDFLRTH